MEVSPSCCCSWERQKTLLSFRFGGREGGGAGGGTGTLLASCRVVVWAPFVRGEQCRGPVESGFTRGTIYVDIVDSGDECDLRCFACLNDKLVL